MSIAESDGKRRFAVFPTFLLIDMDETTLTAVLAGLLLVAAFSAGSLELAGLGAAAFLIPLEAKH